MENEILKFLIDSKFDFLREIAKVQFFAKGFSNINYLIQTKGKKFLFRLNLYPNLFPNKSEKEFFNLKKLEELNFTPKAYFFHKIEKSPFKTDFLIIDYIHGTPLIESSLYTESSIFKELGILIGKLHALPIDEELNYANYSFNYNHYHFLLNLRKKSINVIIKENKSKMINSLIIESFNNLLEETKKITDKSSPVLGHGDLWPGNIIHSDSNLYLIDLEDMGLIDSHFEIANLFYDFGRRISNQEKNLFFEQYCKLCKCSDKIFEQVELWKNIILFKTFLSMFRYFNNLNKKENESNPKFEKEKSQFVFLIQYCIEEGIFNQNNSFDDIKTEIFGKTDT